MIINVLNLISGLSATILSPQVTCWSNITYSVGSCDMDIFKKWFLVNFMLLCVCMCPFDSVIMYFD